MAAVGSKICLQNNLASDSKTLASSALWRSCSPSAATHWACVPFDSVPASLHVHKTSNQHCWRITALQEFHRWVHCTARRARCISSGARRVSQRVDRASHGSVIAHRTGSVASQRNRSHPLRKQHHCSRLEQLYAVGAAQTSQAVQRCSAEPADFSQDASRRPRAPRSRWAPRPFTQMIRKRRLERMFC